MNVQVIYKDDKRTVKMVTRPNGMLLYTRTYIYGEDGYVEKMITVYQDGTVEEQ